jgi:uncharacterized damage-inducible protein DinB
MVVDVKWNVRLSGRKSDLRQVTHSDFCRRQAKISIRSEAIMIKTVEPMLGEFQKECATTRRVLERVPEDKLTWKPHAKSMTLGALAMHIATVPGGIAKLAETDEFDVSQGNFNPPTPKSKGEIFTALDESVKSAEKCIAGMSDGRAQGNWCAKSQGRALFTISRGELLRSIMLNHWYHHRGQLSVYLRLLDVPVPSIYGPSADDNPFM